MIDSYNDFKGFEREDTEYKEFTFNSTGLLINSEDILDICSQNLFFFNDDVIKNLKKYIKIYVPKNACATFNSKLKKSIFYIGINDDGIIKGIPLQGEFPIENFKEYVYKTLSKNLTNSSKSINFQECIKINIIKINPPEKPDEQYHPDFSKYLNERKKHLELLEQYSEDMKDWRIRFNYVNQKLFKLINNIESRMILIEFIREKNPSSSVIDLLYTDYIEVYRQHEEVVILKEDKKSPYYWITRWKDMMIKKLRKNKPQPIKSLFNTPLNLIMNVSEMIPLWMHNNKGMKLYILQIEFNTLNCDDLFSYYDYHKKKWLKCHRTIINGGPACFPL